MSVGCTKRMRAEPAHECYTKITQWRCGVWLLACRRALPPRCRRLAERKPGGSLKARPHCLFLLRCEGPLAGLAVINRAFHRVSFDGARVLYRSRVAAEAELHFVALHG